MVERQASKRWCVTSETQQNLCELSYPVLPRQVSGLGASVPGVVRAVALVVSLHGRWIRFPPCPIVDHAD